MDDKLNEVLSLAEKLRIHVAIERNNNLSAHVSDLKNALEQIEYWQKEYYSMKKLAEDFSKQCNEAMSLLNKSTEQTDELMAYIKQLKNTSQIHV